MRRTARLKIQMAGKTYMLQRKKALVIGGDAGLLDAKPQQLDIAGWTDNK
jgi:hypothetical protein